MSKLINKEALRQSLIKVKQYIDDKLFGNSESLKDLINEEISKGLSTIVDSAPETFDTLKEVAEYITKDEQHAVEVTTKLSNHESAIQSLQTDNVIIKGDVENSAVLKGDYEGYSNKAVSQTSVAIGAATTAGLKGWYYSAIDFTNKKITLSDRPTYILVGSTLLNGGWSSGTPNIKRNDIISLVNNNKYDLCSKVTEISDNVITVDSLPFESLNTDSGAAAAVIAGQFSDGYSIYIPERPDAGLIDFGGGAFSEGGQSMATNICAHAEGLQTHAYGQYSHTEGRDTIAGYAAHAEGSFTIASGNCSHAEGNNTSAIGNNSHAEGFGTEAQNNAEHASGYYNISTKSSDAAKRTHFSIGIGTSDTDRKNAFEVKQNGDIYIEGVEGRIQDKLYNSDWNAQEGEVGYIKNKPFGCTGYLGKVDYYNKIFTISNLSTHCLYCQYNGKVFCIYLSEEIKIVSGPPIWIKLHDHYDNGQQTLTVELIDNYGYISSEKPVLIYSGFLALHSSFVDLTEINYRITQLEDIINEITTQE